MKIFIALNSTNLVQEFMASPNYWQAMNYFIGSDHLTKRWLPYLDTWSRVRGKQKGIVGLEDKMIIAKHLNQQFEDLYGPTLSKVDSMLSGKKWYRVLPAILEVGFYAPDLRLTKKNLTSWSEKFAQAFGPQFKELDLEGKRGVLTLHIKDHK
jgi:hypothetical protein